MSRSSDAEGVPSAEAIRATLHAVIDPELGLDFVELGLIYDVRVEPPAVHVTFSLTSPACGIGPAVAQQITELLADVEGVSKVFPRLTFDPPWTPERMSEDARFALGL